jgi:ATP synthase protein I
MTAHKVIKKNGAQKSLDAQKTRTSDDDAFKPWSQEEALAWRRDNPAVSPWRVVVAQAAVGLICGLIAWSVMPSSEVVLSALYGAATVVIPSALLARGTTANFGITNRSVSTAAFRFVFWESAKLAVAVLMLVMAPRVIQGLSWPTLLITMVVGIKTNWVALLWRHPVVTKITQKS